VPEANVQGLRLLLVEDEVLFAFCIAEVLEDMGADVLGPVASVADAIDLIEKAPEIDAAILDINLGTEVVFPVADRLRTLHVPFVFASAFAPESMPHRFRDIDLCAKPLDVDAVRRAVERMRHVA
jgi:CheY-like chemotaxis protein